MRKYGGFKLQLKGGGGPRGEMGTMSLNGIMRLRVSYFQRSFTLSLPEYPISLEFDLCVTDLTI